MDSLMLTFRKLLLLCIKYPAGSNQQLKAHWILQWHHVHIRRSKAHGSTKLLLLALCNILSISASLSNGTLWSCDVKEAYIQPEAVNRDICTEPPRDSKLPSSKVLKITFAYCRLVESSSSFFGIYYSIFCSHLQLTECMFDLYIPYPVEYNSLIWSTELSTDH